LLPSSTTLLTSYQLLPSAVALAAAAAAAAAIAVAVAVAERRIAVTIALAALPLSTGVRRHTSAVLLAVIFCFLIVDCYLPIP
jgi:hypothetical protein